jgi:uncharacterized protein (TIGR02246 family)
MKATGYILTGLLLAAASMYAVGQTAQRKTQTTNQPQAGAQTAQHAEDEKEIRAATAAFVQAFAKGDAKGLAALFVEDGEAVDGEGSSIQGRAAIEEHYAARFGESSGHKLESTIESIRFLAPGIANEIGRTQVVPAGGGAPDTGRYTAIRLRRDGKWLIASLREVPDEELTHHQHLKELEWLVGDWVEESEGAVVTTSIAWTPDKNFLIRSFDVRVQGKPELSGSQRIGWDPLTKQIKSWVFDSDGGYGEGLWMRHGDQWIVKATSVLPGGHISTATQVLTYVNKDRMRWKSIDRTHGMEVANDIAEIVMVRKAPAPK